MARAYSSSESKWRAIRAVAILLCAGELGALLNGLRAVPPDSWLGLGYAAVGGMAGLALALVVFGLVVRPSVE